MAKLNSRRKSWKTELVVMYGIGIVLPIVVVLLAVFAKDQTTGDSVSSVIDSIELEDEMLASIPNTRQKKPEYSRAQVQSVEHLQKAMQYLEKKKWSNIAEECEKAVEKDPQSVFGYALLGNALNMMMQWDRASDSWRKATELDPENFEFYYHLGFSLSQSAQDKVKNSQKFDLTQQSITSFTTYLQLAENNPEATKEQISLAHSNLGTMYKSIKYAEKQALALTHFEKAAEFDPMNELAFFNIGLMYAERFEKNHNEDDMKSAIDNLQMAVELNPTNKKYAAIRDALMGQSSPAELMAAMQKTEL